MSEHKSLSDFAEQCYAVMDGKLCIVTRGEKGWKCAPINAENSAANHELAALKNKELGVTPEQAKLLVTGAVMGWDALITPETRAAYIHEVFEVEIYRMEKTGVVASLNLPASPFELADAVDKLRLTHKDSSVSIEMLNYELEYLAHVITTDVNLCELNHLAERMASLSDWELDCFEGLVEMETAKGVESIPLERLINFTYSLENCQIAYEAHNDESLGKFYVNNGMSDIPDNLPESLYEMLDYKSIGRKARTGEGGVFTSKGYVVRNGAIAEVYQSGNAVPKENLSHTIELEVCKGFFNDPDYDNDLTAPILLPADDGAVDRAIAQVNAASAEECAMKAVDCIVPNLTGLISDTLYETEGDCYGAVNELAKQLKKLEANGSLVTYKAVVEAAPQSLTLEEAIDLAEQAVNFTLQREMTTPDDYAKAELAKYSLPLRDELIASTDLWRYGSKLMEQNLALTTGYGILSTPDGLTIEQCLGRPAPSQGMEMR